MSIDESSHCLDGLIGKALSSVEFVQEDVQLRFDGPCLTAITLPVVESEGLTRHATDPGYRDALCKCIAKKIMAVKVNAEEIRMDFESDFSISISLKDKDYRGPEAAIFHDGQKPMVVF